MPKAKKVDAANIGNAVLVDTQHAQKPKAETKKPTKAIAKTGESAPRTTAKASKATKKVALPKHKDPNYGQVCVLIPKSLKRDFRQAIEMLETDNSTVVEELIAGWVKKQK